MSIDPDKTRERIVEDFKATTKAEKDEILALSGFVANAYYNVGKSGAASPRVVLSMAQILNVLPFYYTGEIDEKEQCTDKALNEFYMKYKNKKQNADNPKPAVNENAAEAPTNNNTKPDNVKTTINKKTAKIPQQKSLTEKNNQIVEKPEQQPDNSVEKITVEFDNSVKMNKAVQELSEDKAILLLKALLKRAEAGGKAETLSNIMKRCLLS